MAKRRQPRAFKPLKQFKPLQNKPSLYKSSLSKNQSSLSKNESSLSPPLWFEVDKQPDQAAVLNNLKHRIDAVTRRRRRNHSHTGVSYVRKLTDNATARLRRRSGV
jgi:hypothetical protein